MAKLWTPFYSKGSWTSISEKVVSPHSMIHYVEIFSPKIPMPQELTHTKIRPTLSLDRAVATISKLLRGYISEAQGPAKHVVI